MRESVYRGEIKQLMWSDVHLDAPRPFLEVRASTTKNKKGAVIPLVPALAQACGAQPSPGILPGATRPATIVVG